MSRALARKSPQRPRAIQRSRRAKTIAARRPRPRPEITSQQRSLHAARQQSSLRLRQPQTRWARCRRHRHAMATAMATCPRRAASACASAR
eukprot:7446627-Lingulodinium_polyedra.AAC.1